MFSVLVWGLLFLTLYLLRSFFLLVFLTFVFCYIQAGGVEKLQPWIRNRTLRVVLVAATFLAVIIGIGFFASPIIKSEARLLAERYPHYLATLDSRLFELGRNYPFIGDLLPVLEEPTMPRSLEPGAYDLKSSPTVRFLQLFWDSGGESDVRENLRSSVEMLRNIGEGLLALISAFLLALLFSFLILLDLPSLSRSTQSLAETKLRHVYLEVAQDIADFSRVLGRALEAQLFIAVVNTVLTAIGMYALGLSGKVAFLSLIVFLCSFVPVVGVFISSVPICLVALQQSGFGLVLACIALITLIHQIEAYILNPRIYGHHLHMNPVLVLIILTVAGKLFGVWGLVLGVPISRYVFGRAIRLEESAAS